MRWPSIPIFISTIIYTVESLWIINKANTYVFLEFPWFFSLAHVIIIALTVWIQLVHLTVLVPCFAKVCKIWGIILLECEIFNSIQPLLQSQTSTKMGEKCNCLIVSAFFDTAFYWYWNINGNFPIPWPLFSFSYSYHLVRF